MALSTKENIRHKTVRGAIIMVAGLLVSRSINLLTILVLARLLVPADFGLVALGTTLLATLSTITDISVGAALIQRPQVSDKDMDTAFTLTLMRGLLLAAAMVGGGQLMSLIYGDPRLLLICAGLACRPILVGLFSPRFITLSKDLAFGRVAVAETIEYAAQFLVSVAVAWYFQSFWAIVAGALAASLSGLVTTYIMAPYRPNLSLRSTRSIFGFAFWLTLNQVVSTIGNRFDNFVAGGFLGVSVFGAYNVGNNVAWMITQIATQPLEKVLFPGFAKISDDRARLQVAFQKSQASLFAIGLPIGLGIALVAKPFVYLTLGPGWEPAATVIQFIAPVLGMQIVFGPTNALAYSMGATRPLFNRGLIMLLIRVPVILIGLYLYGLVGLLVARLISGGLVLSLVNFSMIRSLIGLGIGDQLRVTWRSWLSGLAMAIVVYVVQARLPESNTTISALVELLCLTLVGAVTYGLTHALLWFAAGRPDIGIEAQLAQMGGKLTERLRRRPAA